MQAQSKNGQSVLEEGSELAIFPSSMCQFLVLVSLFQAQIKLQTNFSERQVPQFPIATITSNLTVNGIKQSKFIVLTVVEISSMTCASPG